MLSSGRGTVSEPANELRSTFVLDDGNGQLYLFYADAGEQNIGIAPLFAK